MHDLESNKFLSSYFNSNVMFGKFAYIWSATGMAPLIKL